MGMSDVGNQHHVSGGQISLLFAMDMAKVAGPYVVFHQFCRLLTWIFYAETTDTYIRGYPKNDGF